MDNEITIQQFVKDLPDLVRDWELDSDVVNDDYTIQTTYVSDPTKGLWRARVDERWEHFLTIGSGSYGTVSLQHCTQGPRAGKHQAVKKIQVRPRLSADEAGVLSRELLAIVKFSHRQYRDSFVRSFGWYPTKDSIFITMEYLRIGDLESNLRGRNKRLPETEAARINILVQNKGPNWWVKLSDFGCSKQIESTALRTKTGTEVYRAPEVAHIFTPSDMDLVGDHSYSLAADIWSVGAIAFRIVTGRLPFPRTDELYRYVVLGHPFPSDDSLSVECASFVTSTMSASQRQRPTAAKALTSPWVNILPTISGVSTSEVESGAITPVSMTSSQFIEEASGRWSTMMSDPASGGVHCDEFPTTRVGDRSPSGSVSTTSNPAVQTFDQDPIYYEAQSISAEPVTPTVQQEGRSTDSRTEAAPTMLMFEAVQNFNVNDLTPLVIVFSADGAHLATSYDNGNLHIFHKNTQAFELPPQSIFLGTRNGQIAFTPDSKQLIVVDKSHVSTYELADGNVFQKLIDHDEIKGPGKRRTRFNACALSSDGRFFVAYLDRDSQCRAWRASESGRYQPIDRHSRVSHSSTSTALQIFCSPDGRRCVERNPMSANSWAVGSDGVANWTGFPFNNYSRSWNESATKFSPDGRWFVLSLTGWLFPWPRPRGRRTIIFETGNKDKWDKRMTMEDTEAPCSVAWSPDSRMLAMGRMDGAIVLWEVDGEGCFTGKHTQQRERHRVNPVWALAFSPDGQRLASGSLGELKVWNVCTSG
ncbi:hypothetical protein AK830_g9974 [Neonectria ditissima]|uniref:mitogen-activated protein kinase n=1 Tax=Neonectria ditissima TaxID=78410 RepID=A0A0P7B7W2_9HYPO|nr:hypothetical protein AK830_g9974 [Neonectria ditissima]